MTTRRAIALSMVVVACGGEKGPSWGRIDGGRLGDGTTTNRSTPVRVVQ